MFTNKYYIRRITADGSQMKVMFQDLKNVVSMDFHAKNDDIFFADVGAKTVFKAKIDDKDSKTAVIR